MIKINTYQETLLSCDRIDIFVGDYIELKLGFLPLKHWEKVIRARKYSLRIGTLFTFKMPWLVVNLLIGRK